VTYGYYGRRGDRDCATISRVPDDEDDHWSYTGVPHWVAIGFAVVVGLGLLAAALQAWTHS